MKVNEISRKFIKPYTPTPQTLNKYKLSFTDELIPPLYMSVVLFYPPNPKPKPTIDHLEESLARILPQFYPYAGRYIKSNHFVDCNDEGAEFVEAEATDIELMDDLITGNTKNEQHDNLLSRQTYDVDKPEDPLLSVQITRFKCGGLAVGVSLSHRISDASSLGTFVAALSNANRLDADAGTFRIIPSFDSPRLFPGTDLKYDSEEPPHNVVVKRLLFNKESISTLRSMLRPRNGQRFLSRVRIVSAVIAKALLGIELAKNGKSRACFIGQAVNMRGRTNPPLHEHSCGNLVVQTVTQCMAANETKGIGLQELVDIIGDAIDRTIQDCAKLLSLDLDGRSKILSDPLVKMFEVLKSGDNIAMWFTDWSKFGLYEADFGWGIKPVWVRIGTVRTKNLTVLMGNKEGDGIEAWVHLDPKDVPYFEEDEYMKLFKIA